MTGGGLLRVELCGHAHSDGALISEALTSAAKDNDLFMTGSELKRWVPVTAVTHGSGSLYS